MRIDVLPWGFLILAFVGLMFVFTGLHSIDNAWNINYVNNISDLNLVDTNVLGQRITASSLYNLGTQQIMLGTFLLIVGLLGLAYTTPRRKDDGKKKTKV